MNGVSFQRHLTENIIPFWNECADNVNGGFCGYIGHDMQKDIRTSTADFRTLSERVVKLETKIMFRIV